MSETIPQKLHNVIQVDEDKIQQHLGDLVRGTVEETLNTLLDAEADQLCNASRYERTEARKDTRSQGQTLPHRAADRSVPGLAGLRCARQARSGASPFPLDLAAASEKATGESETEYF